MGDGVIADGVPLRFEGWSDSGIDDATGMLERPCGSQQHIPQHWTDWLPTVNDAGQGIEFALRVEATQCLLPLLDAFGYERRGCCCIG